MGEGDGGVVGFGVSFFLGECFLEMFDRFFLSYRLLLRKICLRSLFMFVEIFGDSNFEIFATGIFENGR